MMDPITDIVSKMAKDVEEAKAKYDPMVKNLTDASFIAIFQSVMEERDRRMQRLILENPVVRQIAMMKLAEQMKESRDDPER